MPISTFPLFTWCFPLGKGMFFVYMAGEADPQLEVNFSRLYLETRQRTRILNPLSRISFQFYLLLCHSLHWLQINPFLPYKISGPEGEPKQLQNSPIVNSLFWQVSDNLRVNDAKNVRITICCLAYPLERTLLIFLML